MAAAWAIVGVGVGVAVASSSGVGSVCYAANAVAGVIVCLPLGAILGLFLDRFRESLVGATFGLGVGVIVEHFSGRDFGDQMLGHSLIVGGLVAATAVPAAQLAISTIVGFAELLTAGLRKRQA
jgi:hypothetical protein